MIIGSRMEMHPRILGIIVILELFGGNILYWDGYLYKTKSNASGALFSHLGTMGIHRYGYSRDLTYVLMLNGEIADGRLL